MIYEKDDVKYIDSIYYTPSYVPNLCIDIYPNSSALGYFTPSGKVAMPYCSDGNGNLINPSEGFVSHRGKLNDDGTIDETVQLPVSPSPYVAPFIYCTTNFDGCTEVSFETNIPMFNHITVGGYIKGTVGFEDALNYNKVWRNDEWVEV